MQTSLLFGNGKVTLLFKCCILKTYMETQCESLYCLEVVVSCSNPFTLGKHLQVPAS